MERTDYEKQAQEFLDRFGLTVKAAFKGDRCPPWEGKGGCIHGDRYRVTIRTNSASEWRTKSISFDFWNSYSDMREGKHPTAYAILASISGEAFSPTNPDDVAEEFGPIPPSQAIAVARFACRLQDFFTEEELEALGEIS